MFPRDYRLTFRTNMKKLALICFSAITLFHSHAQARVEINFDFFYDSLAPLGEWSKVGGYGYVWHPSDVDEDWSPYSDGYWSYTDAGWTWVSYEDWGGITYHYGRWAEIEDYGWCWVPGYEWGPAWVSWRKNDDHVGWAPLPPEAHFRRETGFGVWVDTHFDIGPGSFRFCNVRDFGAPVLRNVFLPRHENINFISNTINITNISYRRDNGYAFNGGIDYDWIAPRCERPIPALKLVQNTTNIYVTGNKGNVFINAQKGNQLIVAAPAISQRANYSEPTRQLVVAKNIAAPVVKRGWAGINQGGQRDQLLMKMREQDRGVTPATAPARAVKVAQLAVVPKKGNPNAKLPSLLKVPAARAPQTTPVAGAPTAQPAAEGQPGVVAKPRTDIPQTSTQPVIAAEPSAGKPAAAVGDTQPPRGPGGLRGKPGATDRNRDGKPDRTLPVARPERPDSKVAEQPATKPAADPAAMPQSVTETKAERLLKARQQNEAAAQATKAAAAERAQQTAQTARAAKEQKDAAKAAAATANAEANARDNAAATERANAIRQQKAESLQRASEAGAEKRRQSAETSKADDAKRAAQAAARREAAQSEVAQSAQQAAAKRASQDAAREQGRAAQRQQAAEAQQRAMENARRQAPPQIQRQPQPQQQSLQPGQELVPQDPRSKKKKSSDQ